MPRKKLPLFLFAALPKQYKNPIEVIGDVKAMRRRCAVAHNAASSTAVGEGGAGEMRKPGSVVIIKVSDRACVDASGS